MQNWPINTIINKKVPLDKFMSMSKTTDKIKKLLEEEIDNIIWLTKISHKSLNLPFEELAEFQIFEIQIKSLEIDNKALVHIQKYIPYPILFLVHGIKGYRLASVRLVDNNYIVMKNDWSNKYNIEIAGRTIDEVYSNLINEIANIYPAKRISIDKYQDIMQIKKIIKSNQNKIKHTKNIKMRQHLAKINYELEIQLKELIN